MTGLWPMMVPRSYHLDPEKIASIVDAAAQAGWVVV